MPVPGWMADGLHALHHSICCLSWVPACVCSSFICQPWSWSQLHTKAGHSQNPLERAPRSISKGFLRMETTSDRKATWESLDSGDLYKASLVAQMLKNMPASAGDPASIPGSGRSPGEGNGNSLQYSCLENSMDRGAWRATVHGIAKSRTQLTQ